MKLTVTIDADETGVRCQATMDGADAIEVSEANILAIGALEIAKAALLARRWGVNISGMDETAATLPASPGGATLGG